MKLKIKLIGLLFICLLSATESNAQEPMLGEVRIFAGNFAPRGWAFCDGQLLAISQNSALFSLLGTMYGGDGRTTFGLPDLRGRVAMSAGRHRGSSYNYRQGQMGGAENTTLNIAQMPSHNHFATFSQTSGIVTTPAVNGEANSDVPTDNALAIPNIGGSNQIYSTGTVDTQLKNGTTTVQGNVTVGNNGGNQAFDNRQPYAVIRYIIALQGIFPSRS